MSTAGRRGLDGRYLFHSPVGTPLCRISPRPVGRRTACDHRRQKLTLGKAWVDAGQRGSSARNFTCGASPHLRGYLVTRAAFSPHPTLWNATLLATSDLRLVRAVCEERTLARDPAYATYMQQVRWRVLPGCFWAGAPAVRPPALLDSSTPWRWAASFSLALRQAAQRRSPSGRSRRSAYERRQPGY
jgi:hypothetical protein